MIHELRIYHMHEGKMEDICNRFKNHTLKYFPNYGIKVTDFWVDAEGKNTLYYICEFEDREKMAAAWKSFELAPEWVEARDKSEEAGPIVSKVQSFIMEQAGFFTK